MSKHIQPEPPPEASDSPAVWPLVIAEVVPALALGHSVALLEELKRDMEARDEQGVERYGTPLRVYNGRDALVDAYQEALDLAVYLRQAIERGHDVNQSYVLALHLAARLKRELSATAAPTPPAGPAT